LLENRFLCQELLGNQSFIPKIDFYAKNRFPNPKIERKRFIMLKIARKSIFMPRIARSPLSYAINRYKIDFFVPNIARKVIFIPKITENPLSL